MICVQTPDENNLGLMLRQVKRWVVHRMLTFKEVYEWVNMKSVIGVEN